MSRIQSNPSLILFALVWYALTGVMGVSLHHHLGWHPVAGVPATYTVCQGGWHCGMGVAWGGSSCSSTLVSTRRLARNDVEGLSLAPDLRPATNRHQWSHCPICQFQVQPRAPQPVLPCFSVSHVRWASPHDPVQWVAFTPDFSWQSRAPPTV